MLGIFLAVLSRVLDMPASPKIYLITGGHGFIGSHIARCLYKLDNVHVRVVDISPRSSFVEPICPEFIRGDLRLPAVCEHALKGVHTVLHFAANMGGMGTMHSDNDFVLYQDNHTMTTNVLHASIATGVQRFAYASSACVYREERQCHPNEDVSLRESDVWTCPPPKHQGLYGLEKLASELLIHHFSSGIDFKVARFHNVYGHKGSWNDGREKAPAALLRKALCLKHIPDQSTRQNFEIWGDGHQRRSFLYIDDAVEGFLKPLDSNKSGPFNIGSDAICTIRELAKIALSVTLWL